MVPEEDAANQKDHLRSLKNIKSDRRKELGEDVSTQMREILREADETARAERTTEVRPLPRHQELSEANREHAIFKDPKAIEGSTGDGGHAVSDYVAEPNLARSAATSEALKSSKAVDTVDVTIASADTAEKTGRPAQLSPLIPPTVRSLINEADALYANDPERETQLFRTKIYAQRIELVVLVNDGLRTEEAFDAYCEERSVRVERRTAEKRFHTITKGLWPPKDRERKKPRISEEADYARAVVEVAKVVPEKGRVVDWINTPGLPSGQNGKGKTGLQKLKAFRLTLPDVQAKEKQKSAEQIEQDEKYVAEEISNGPTFGEFELDEAAFRKLKSLEAKRQGSNPDDDEDVNGLSIAVLHWVGDGRFRVGELITRDPVRVARIHKKERG